jgi:hypothetical protein
MDSVEGFEAVDADALQARVHKDIAGITVDKSSPLYNDPFHSDWPFW